MVLSQCIGPSFNCSPQILAIFDDLGYVVPLPLGPHLSDKCGQEYIFHLVTICSATKLSLRRLSTANRHC